MGPTNTVNSQIFSHGAVVRYGGNYFIKVPILLQVDGTPLIEVIINDAISRTTQFTVFGSDGANLATVVGTRLHRTREGEQAGLEVKYPSRMIVCTIGDKVMFEVRRVAAASLAISAEIYSPTGLLVRADATVPFATISKEGSPIASGSISEKRIRNTAVGYSVTEQGKTICLGEDLVGKPWPASSPSRSAPCAR